MVEKQKQFNIECDPQDYPEQSCFKFKELSLNEGKSYVATYEDLMYFNETVKFKDKLNRIPLPSEIELVENPQLLQDYLQQIEENDCEEELEQFLQQSSQYKYQENMQKLQESQEEFQFNSQKNMQKIQELMEEFQNIQKEEEKTVIQKDFILNSTIRTNKKQTEQSIQSLGESQINDKGAISVSVKQSLLKFNTINIDLAGASTLSQAKNTIIGILEDQGYTNLTDLGSGAFGIVIKAKNKSCQSRALKIQFCDKDSEDVEFKLGRLLFYEGIENLYGNSVQIYNMFLFEDTYSNKRIAMIEMEVAEKNLQELLDEKMSQGTQKMQETMDEEEFREICIQLVGNVLCMHNLNMVHKDIKKENILIFGSIMVLADFGLTEELEEIIESQYNPKTDTFCILQGLAGTPLYMSPIFKNALKSKQVVMQCDPFKNDIYALGLNLLEIQLLRKGMSRNNIIPILRDPVLAYQQATQNNINQYFNRGSQFFSGDKVFQIKNILSQMLEIEEEKRISSVKLALVCQLDRLILSRIRMPYKKIFPPSSEKLTNKQYKINYTLKNYIYVGDALEHQKELLRHGKGKLTKQNGNIVYDGQWNMDLPNGWGKFCFFQDNWVYEGYLVDGLFKGHGTIKYKDSIVYKGEFKNLLLNEFLENSQHTLTSFPLKTRVLFHDKVIEMTDFAD